MFPNSPEKIVSFEVVPASCLEYPSELGERVVYLTKEHVVALDSEGMLWARNVAETSWTCLNPPQTRPGWRPTTSSFFNLAVELGVSVDCAAAVWYLRTRSRHTPELEAKLIALHAAGIPPNISNFGVTEDTQSYIRSIASGFERNADSGHKD